MWAAKGSESIDSLCLFLISAAPAEVRAEYRKMSWFLGVVAYYELTTGFTVFLNLGVSQIQAGALFYLSLLGLNPH